MEYVGQILSQCRKISWSVSEVKTLKKRCRLLCDRVRAIEELVQGLQQRGSGSMTPAVTRALYKLCVTLMSAEDLIKKCTKTRLLSSKYKSEFNSVNEQLRDAFVVLSSVPQVNQGNAGMHPIFQDFSLEDDDDDWDLGLGQLVPVGPRGAMAPAMAPRPFPAAAPTVTAMYASMMEVEDGNVVVAEAFFISQ